MKNEIERIKAAYGRRMRSELQRRYDPDGPAQSYLLHRREEETLKLLRQAFTTPLQAARVLEIGCGRGHGLLDWRRRGIAADSLHGVDLIEPFAYDAQARVPGSHVAVASADRLPYPSASFDIVAQHTVLTSILDARMRAAVAKEMQRVTAPGGVVLCFDFRYSNWFNPDVCGVRIDALKSLFPGWVPTVRTLILLPPLARALAPLSVQLCRYLETAAPFLRSHYVVLLRRPT